MKRLFLLIVLIIPVNLLAANKATKADTLSFNANQFLDKYPQVAELRKSLTKIYKPGCFDGCGYGYDTEWKIINKKLYLCKIYGCCSNNIVADLNKLFKGQVKNGRVAATWVTDTLWIPTGKYIHNSDFRSFYNQETFISFENGQLDYLKVFDYPTSIEMPYPNGLLSKFIQENINWKNIPPIKEKMVKVFCQFTSGATIHPDNIKIIRGSKYPAINEEAIRVLKLVKWGIYYSHGKVYRETYTIPFTFSEEDRH